MLRHVLQPESEELKPRIIDYQEHGKLYLFDQRPYFASVNGQINPDEHKLNENGYLYVPDKCANTSTPCHVHVHFHGCDLSSVTIKDLYVRKTGILEFAASNDIITIFPQVKD